MSLTPKSDRPRDAAAYPRSVLLVGGKESQDCRGGDAVRAGLVGFTRPARFPLTAPPGFLRNAMCRGRTKRLRCPDRRARRSPARLGTSRVHQPTAHACPDIAIRPPSSSPDVVGSVVRRNPPRESPNPHSRFDAQSPKAEEVCKSKSDRPYIRWLPIGSPSPPLDRVNQTRRQATHRTRVGITWRRVGRLAHEVNAGLPGFLHGNRKNLRPMSLGVEKRCHALSERGPQIGLAPAVAAERPGDTGGKRVVSRMSADRINRGSRTKPPAGRQGDSIESCPRKRGHATQNRMHRPAVRMRGRWKTRAQHCWFDWPTAPIRRRGRYSTNSTGR